MKQVMESITEREFSSNVVEVAKTFGWRIYRTWLPIHSPAGFPDLVLVRPPRLIFAELKSMKGKLTPLQEDWLALLEEIPGQEVYLWRPSMMQEIAETLARRGR